MNIFLMMLIEYQINLNENLVYQGNRSYRFLAAFAEK